MKKIIILSIVFFSWHHYIQIHASAESPTIITAIFQKTLVGSTSSIFILPEEALAHPLTYTQVEPDGNLATLEFIGFQLSDGSDIYYPQPEKPQFKKLAHLPKHYNDQLTCINIASVRQVMYLQTLFSSAEISCGEYVGIKPDYALQLPLEFDIHHPDEKVSNLTFAGFTFLNGHKLRIPKLPEDPTYTKIDTLPEFPDQTPSYKKAIPLELSKIKQYTPTSWE